MRMQLFLGFVAAAYPTAASSPIALSTPSQSSTWGSYTAGKVLDGQASTMMVTQSTTDPWWSASYSGGAAIGDVKVTNRGDAHSHMTGTIAVWLGSSVNDKAVQCGQNVDASGGAGPYTFNCGGATGKSYVTVAKVGSGYLSIAEVEVFTS